MNRPVVHWFLSSCFVFLCSTITSAQWSAEGVPIVDGPISGVGRWQVVADHEGGFYSVYDASGLGCRVQKFDSLGYRLWGEYGLRMFPDSLDYAASFMGADSTSDGGVIVCFTNYTIHPETGIDVYAQRFSPDGERLFGPTGAVLSEAPGHQMIDGAASKQTIGDRNGGIWAIMLTDVATSTTVNGVNGDGTQKRTTDYVVATDDIEIDSHCGFGTDINGGFVAAWTDNSGLYPIRRWKRIWLDVNGIEVDPPKIIAERDFDSFYDIDIHGLQDGGLFFSSWSDYQREYADHALHWDLDLEHHYLGLVAPKPSNSVLTAGENVQRVFYAQSGAYLYWLQPDGSPVLDEALTQVDTTRLLNTVFRTPLFADRDSLTTISVNSRHQNDPVISYVVSSKWNSEGLNDWGRSITVMQTLLSFGFLTGAGLADNSIAIALRRHGYDDFYLHFKIRPDGSVAGVESDIVSLTSDAVPNAFNLVNAYPNPFNASIQFSLEVLVPGLYTASLYNLIGQQVDFVKFNLVPGANSVTYMPKKQLVSGVYFVRWTDGQKLIAQRKIVFMQ